MLCPEPRSLSVAGNEKVVEGMFSVTLLCIKCDSVMEATYHCIYLPQSLEEHFGMKGDSICAPASFIHAANFSPADLVLSPAVRLHVVNVHWHHSADGVVSRVCAAVYLAIGTVAVRER